MTHYGMWLKHGDPLYADKGLHLASLGREGNTVKDFWAKVRKIRGCWMWLAGKDYDGYGVFWYENKQWRAPRFLAQVILGLDITGKEVCHHCDAPSCVNPSHIFIGTAKDNSADSKAKGRNVRGEKCHTSVVTESEVREIRRLARVTRQSHRVIANLFELSRAQTSSIIRRDSWKHVA